MSDDFRVVHRKGCPPEIPDLLMRSGQSAPERIGGWDRAAGSVLVYRGDRLDGVMTYNVINPLHVYWLQMWHEFESLRDDERVWQIRKYATYGTSRRDRYRVWTVLDAAWERACRELELRHVYAAVLTNTHMYPVVSHLFERRGFRKLPTPWANYQSWGVAL